MAKEQKLHRIRTIRRKKGDPTPPADENARSGEQPDVPVAPERTAVQVAPTPPTPKKAKPPKFDPEKLQAELNALGPDPMAQLLGDTGPIDPEPGDRITGKIVGKSSHGIFVDIGAKAEAIIDRGDFNDPDTLEIGESVTAFVLSADDTGIRLAKRLSGAGAREMLAEAKTSKIPVEGTVVSRNTGGFTVRVSGIDAFCPISQIARHPVMDLDTYLGQSFCFHISEIRGRDVVVSRREIEREELAEAAKQIWLDLKVGDQREGVVTGVENFGVFVDVGGVQGLVHASELGWNKDTHPPEKGTPVQVRVLSVDVAKGRISLSMKDPSMGPWARVGTEFQVGSHIEGTVTQVTDFGAFVRIAPGLEGLVHISEMSEHHVDHPRSIVKTGQAVKVYIIEIERERERIALSMKEPASDWKPPTKKKAQSLGTFADLMGSLKLN
jgi:small subunit ribosomal protein S1